MARIGNALSRPDGQLWKDNVKRLVGKLSITSDCWIWTGFKNDRNYGMFHMKLADGTLKAVMAHRASYVLFTSPLAFGDMVLHKCDNPACIRPDHLRVGSANDNTQDMINRGRAWWMNPRREEKKRNRKMGNPKWIRYKTRDERFMDKVLKLGNDRCWLWSGGTNVKGYGIFRFVDNDGRASTQLAHRTSWMIYRGEISDDMCVLHRCDNRQCVNPDHLFLGTQTENVEDMIRKGRQGNCSDKHPGAKLTWESVNYIRNCNESNLALALKYNVDPATISSVRQGKTWRKKIIDGKMTEAINVDRS